MDFYEWLDNFMMFLKGYYAGLTLEKRCRTATEIITEAIQAYKHTCNKSDWVEEEG